MISTNDALMSRRSAVTCLRFVNSDTRRCLSASRLSMSRLAFSRLLAHTGIMRWTSGSWDNETRSKVHRTEFQFAFGRLSLMGVEPLQLIPLLIVAGGPG